MSSLSGVILRSQNEERSGNQESICHIDMVLIISGLRNVTYN